MKKEGALIREGRFFDILYWGGGEPTFRGERLLERECLFDELRYAGKGEGKGKTITSVSLLGTGQLRRPPQTV